MEVIIICEFACDFYLLFCILCEIGMRETSWSFRSPKVTSSSLSVSQFGGYLKVVGRLCIANDMWSTGTSRKKTRSAWKNEMRLTAEHASKLNLKFIPEQRVYKYLGRAGIFS